MPVTKITTMEDAPEEASGPDPRWFHPLVAAAVLYALAGIPSWTHLPPMVLALVGIVATIAAVSAVRNRWHSAEHGKDLPGSLGTVVAIGGTLGSVWMVWAAQQPHQAPWLTSTLAVGALAMLTAGVAVFYAVLVSRAPRLAKLNHDRIAAGHDLYRSMQDEQAIDEWEQILRTVQGCEGLKVLQRVTTEGGTTLHLLDDPEKPLKLTGLQDKCGAIESVAAHRLAAKGIKLRTGKVTAEPGDAAHLLLLHINTNNRFRESIPFEPSPVVPRSIQDQHKIAVYEDGRDATLDLYGIHGAMVGATGSGKDVFLNNIIARVSECNDARLWVGGSDKLSPLVWPWLLPWFTRGTQQPIFDRIAGEDPYEVLRMLADLLHAVKLQNKRLGPRGNMRTPTPDDPGIVCIITEATDLLRAHGRKKVPCFDGQQRTGSQLIDDICRSGRSAGYSLILTSQYGLMDAFGDYGTFAKRNITLRVVGKTMSAFDGDSTLVGLRRADTTKLTDYTLLIQPSKEEPRVLPAKAAYLDLDEQIAPIVTRNTPNMAGGLPDWIATQLAHYAGRWAGDRLPDLVENVEWQGHTWPSPSLPVSVTVGGHGQASDSPARVEDKGMKTERLMDEARALFGQAREEIRKYGPLGETMSLVLDAARAADSPDFLPVSPLAIVTGISPNGGDTAAGEGRLVRELSGKPWGLAPVEHDGVRGWWKRDVIDRCREFLTGEKTPTPQLGEDTTALLAAIARTELSLSGEAVRSAEVLTVAAGELGWPDNTEGARRVADALRPLGVEAFRPTAGERAMSYPCAPIRAAIDRYVTVAA